MKTVGNLETVKKRQWVNYLIKIKKRIMKLNYLLKLKNMFLVWQNKTRLIPKKSFGIKNYFFLYRKYSNIFQCIDILYLLQNQPKKSYMD